MTAAHAVLGAEAARRSVVALSALTMLPLLAQEPVRLPGDWAQRDLEGKWTFYRRDVEQNSADKNRQQTWAKLLGGEKEFELLEMLGLFEGWRFAGPALVEGKAPQTFRVALWNLGAFDSHNLEAAVKVFELRPDDAHAWFLANPPAQRGRGAATFDRLKKLANPSQEPPDQLPALDPVQVLVPLLDAPARLDEFGDRLRAEGGRRYVHQVLRGLDGVLVCGDVDAMLVPKVLALTRHAHAKVRTAAFATMAKVPPELVPDEPLLRIADGDGDAESRRLATMALGYAGHPRAFFALVRIAASDEHPGAENARTLLVGLGDVTTMGIMSEGVGRHYATYVLDNEGLARLDDQLGKRLAGVDLTDASLVRRWLERAAWLQVSGDPRAQRTAEAMVAALQQRIPAQHKERVAVQAQQAPKSTPYRGDEAAAMQAAVAALAAQLRTPTAEDAGR